MKFCQIYPNEALLKLSKVGKSIPSMGQNYPAAAFKFVALSHKIRNILRGKSRNYAAEMRSAVNEWILEYLTVRKDIPIDGRNGLLHQLHAYLLEIAPILEQMNPGKLEELLGFRTLGEASLVGQGSVPSSFARESVTPESRRLALLCNSSGPGFLGTHLR